ncbi:probable RNA-binding protein CG14230 isoform X1 [Nasonia vitripennis]|uniref:RRM domain-containing protein n=1 Tax=Nasonia vitripennis TaxID=7425 RepID=A0A7M7QMN0_NASVI|nr:probable RNA-binding protein CG14230 isoform X1 [Nasonia vitripennis]
MEKDFRLFIKNLPLNITEARIKELLGKYATIKNIDLKDKKSLDDQINKFAFVNVTTSDKNLHACFGDLNGERIDGFQISVELAKESFLERLKRERTENKVKPQPPVIPTKEECSRPDFFNNADTASRTKCQTFSETDFSSKNFTIKVQKLRHKHNIDIQDEIKEADEALHVQASSDQENLKPKVSKESNAFVKHKKQVFFDEDGLESEKIKDEINLKNKSFDSLNRDNKKQTVSHIPEKPTAISESEKKRLMSLKQKKQAFRTQQQAIRDALNSVDKNQSSNKIKFDDDIDVQITKTQADKSAYRKNALFESDDENEEKIDWDEVELDAKALIKKKLLKLQTNIGNDKRFVLDERFVDDEDKKEESTQNNVDDVEDEKKWQLDILGNVLGKSIKLPTADSSDTVKKKNKMIRYDPTASNHQDYEVKIEKSNEEKPCKKKKKVSSTEVEEAPVVPRSKEVFYDVSEKLVESLKQNGDFSLLKTFGRDTLETDDSKANVNNETEENKGSFQFNFNAKNPFRYDSSDDEDGNDEPSKTSHTKDIAEKGTIFTRQKDDRFFFTHNDPRFEEAEQFFKKQAIQEEGAFKNRRRELKEIVRSKIRNNLKKTIPWNKRKVHKIRKK